MTITAYVSGYEKVVAVLGYFPGFHDAEVIGFSIQRALSVGQGENTSNLSVHVRNYKTVGEGTAQYAQVLTKSVLVNFTFHGAEDVVVSGFNRQNVINGITVNEIPESSQSLVVEIESIWGFGCRLKCRSVEVSSVEELSVQ